MNNAENTDIYHKPDITETGQIQDTRREIYSC